MTRSLVLLVLLFLFSACQTGERGSTTPRSDTVSATQEGGSKETNQSQCQNPEAGYSVAYPEDWVTNSGEVMASCSLFDPEPIQIEPATEIPFAIAVSIRWESVPYERIIGEQESQRELSRETTRVDGKEATILETEATEALLRPAGARSYRYIVDLGGQTLVASTYDEGTIDYETKKRTLDRMMNSLRFTGQ